jgi:hypothetical protein
MLSLHTPLSHGLEAHALMAEQGVRWSLSAVTHQVYRIEYNNNIRLHRSEPEISWFPEGLLLCIQMDVMYNPDSMDTS